MLTVGVCINVNSCVYLMKLTVMGCINENRHLNMRRFSKSNIQCAIVVVTTLYLSPDYGLLSVVGFTQATQLLSYLRHYNVLKENVRPVGIEPT